MTLRRTFFRLAAPAALVLLGACTTPFRANVARFQMMPPPQGQTFAVQASDPHNQGGIEFAMYQQLVTNRLAAQGYTPVVEGSPATLIVSLDYGIDDGHEKVYSTFGGLGGYGGFGYGGFGYGGFGYGRGFGYGGFGRFGGWGDPFWGGPDVESYTYYVSHVDMQIRRSADSRVVFEGRARARSVDHRLPELVPNLVDALFTGFPGRSGEDVLVTLPPPGKAGTTSVRPAPATHSVPINRTS